MLASFIVHPSCGARSRWGPPPQDEGPDFLTDDAQAESIPPPQPHLVAEPAADQI